MSRREEYVEFQRRVSVLETHKDSLWNISDKQSSRITKLETQLSALEKVLIDSGILVVVKEEPVVKDYTVTTNERVVNPFILYGYSDVNVVKHYKIAKPVKKVGK